MDNGVEKLFQSIEGSVTEMTVEKEKKCKATEHPVGAHGKLIT